MAFVCGWIPLLSTSSVLCHLVSLLHDATIEAGMFSDVYCWNTLRNYKTQSNCIHHPINSLNHHPMHADRTIDKMDGPAQSMLLLPSILWASQ